MRIPTHSVQDCTTRKRSDQARRLAEEISVVSCLGLWLAALALLVAGAPNASAEGIAASDIFPTGGVDQVSISPHGNWVAAITHKADKTTVKARRVGEADIISVFSTKGRVGPLRWVGRNTLLFHVVTQWGRSNRRIDLAPIDNGRFLFERRSLRPDGWLVDAMPLVDEKVLWAFERNGLSTVHEVTLDDLLLSRRETRRHYAIQVGKTVASLRGSVAKWVTTEEHRVVAAYQRYENAAVLFFRAVGESKFREVARDDGPDSIEFFPHTTADEDRHLIVSGYINEDTVGLWEFDPESRKIVREIYRRSDADVVFVDVDPISKEAVSVAYRSGGETQNHYFDDYADFYRERIGDLHEAHNALIVSRTEDQTRFVYWISGPTEPGSHYYRDSLQDETFLIGRTGNAIDRSRLAPMRDFVVESADGTTIEAYLTLPRSPAVRPVPLIVMPHGGPVDVRDSKAFQPLVQYLASWGFAVLQPNYRGSAGYGKSFREAGRKQWARGIEDDIDAAVEKVMAIPEIDATRICIAGGSYGGFSAIASIIRHKDRYRCAVTINGVMDVPFMGETSDIADSAASLARFQARTGDFDLERKELIDISPVYHLQSVETPVLAIYGTADRRVDPDHSVRLILMMELYGKEVEEIAVPGASHSFDREQWIEVAPQMKDFLTRHLMPIGGE